MGFTKIIVHVDHGKDHAPDSEKVYGLGEKIDTFKRKIELLGDLDDQQRKRLLEKADKCSVHKTLSTGNQIFTELL